jgi:hypothetical protein
MLYIFYDPYKFNSLIGGCQTIVQQIRMASRVLTKRNPFHKAEGTIISGAAGWFLLFTDLDACWVFQDRISNWISKDS